MEPTEGQWHPILTQSESWLRAQEELRQVELARDQLLERQREARKRYERELAIYRGEEERAIAEGRLPDREPPVQPPENLEQLQRLNQRVLRAGQLLRRESYDPEQVLAALTGREAQLREETSARLAVLRPVLRELAQLHGTASMVAGVDGQRIGGSAPRSLAELAAWAEGTVSALAVDVSHLPESAEFEPAENRKPTRMELDRASSGVRGVFGGQR